jgi:hypothetical protein
LPQNGHVHSFVAGLILARLQAKASQWVQVSGAPSWDGSLLPGKGSGLKMAPNGMMAARPDFRGAVYIER